MYNWHKDIVQWTIKNTLYLSIVFTWQLPKAREIAALSKKKVIVGGPAVTLMPNYLADVAEIQTATCFDVLSMHNPFATFTTRGCIKTCAICAVPRIEGNLIELETWQAKPLICDNNLLAGSISHFDRVIDSVKRFPLVDFNQGTDATLFEPYHAKRMSELKAVKLRFAFDSADQEEAIVKAVELAQTHGIKDIGVYVLLNYNDTPGDAIYRLEIIRGLKSLPNPMRYQPLTTLKKNEHVADNWTEYDLQKVMQYYSRLIWYGSIPFDEFKPKTTAMEQQLALTI